MDIKIPDPVFRVDVHTSRNRDVEEYSVGVCVGEVVLYHRFWRDSKEASAFQYARNEEDAVERTLNEFGARLADLLDKEYAT